MGPQGRMGLAERGGKETGQQHWTQQQSHKGSYKPEAAHNTLPPTGYIIAF